MNLDAMTSRNKYWRKTNGMYTSKYIDGEIHFTATGSQVCFGCKSVCSLSNFQYSSETLSGYSRYCNSCGGDSATEKARTAKSWARKNRAARRAAAAASTAKRRTKIDRARPKWADDNRIKQIYLQCELTRRVTGIDYHVDHIIPLNGVAVCGLHVPENLQIIEADENIKKSNRF